MRPDLADTPLKGAQMRNLIASRKQGLKFPKNISATSRGIRLHPGENLLPLPGERVLAGPSPVQNTRTFLLLLEKLICFSLFRQYKIRHASCKIKRQKLRGRRRLAGRSSVSFTMKGRLLQVFYLLEEPKGIERFPYRTQLLLLG